MLKTLAKIKLNNIIFLLLILLNIGMTANAATSKWNNIAPDPDLSNTNNDDSYDSVYIAALISLVGLGIILFIRNKYKNNENDIDDEIINDIGDRTVSEANPQSSFVDSEDNNEIRQEARESLNEIYNYINLKKIELNSDDFLTGNPDNEKINELYKLARSKIENIKNILPQDSKILDMASDCLQATVEPSVPSINAMIDTLKNIVR